MNDIMATSNPIDQPDKPAPSLNGNDPWPASDPFGPTLTTGMGMDESTGMPLGQPSTQGYQGHGATPPPGVSIGGGAEATPPSARTVTGRRNMRTGLTNAEIAQRGIGMLPLGTTASATAMSGAGSSPVGINNQVADNNLGYRLNQASLAQPAIVNTMELGSDAASLQMRQSEMAAAAADGQRQTYALQWDPVTKKFISEADSYGSEADQAESAAKAGSAADLAENQAREGSARSMAAMGINPNSGRFVGLQDSIGIQGAANKAAMMTAAANERKDKGISLRQAATQLGSTALNNANNTATIASSLGTSATNSANAGVSDLLNTSAMVGQGFNAQQNAQATAQGASDNAASRSLSSERYDAAKAEADAARETQQWVSGAQAAGSIISSLWG